MRLFYTLSSINKISNIFRLKFLFSFLKFLLFTKCECWKINKRQNEIFNKVTKYVLSLGYIFLYWVNLLWINYVNWQDVLVDRDREKVLHSFSISSCTIKPKGKSRKNYGMMSHYENYCFIVSLPTSFIPVDSWLFCLFYFYTKKNLEQKEIKIHNKNAWK